jgi:hypothetical protein
MNVQEQIERIEPTTFSPVHKSSAVLSAILAVALALFEFGDHTAQHRAADFNSKARDAWGGFQDKTLQQTFLRSFAQAVLVITPPETRTEALNKADGWMQTVARYESDPVQKDGRKELRALGSDMNMIAISLRQLSEHSNLLRLLHRLQSLFCLPRFYCMPFGFRGWGSAWAL